MVKATIKVPVRRYPGMDEASDGVAVEEPLEIVLNFVDGEERREQVAAITMRTPGADAALAVGFLFTEGVITRPEDIEEVMQEEANRVVVRLSDSVVVDLAGLERHFYTTSSCGLCGKTSIDALRAVAPYPTEPPEPLINASCLLQLPAHMAAAQSAFGLTGSTHASGLFDLSGNLLTHAEDVGRHNALDKLIGERFTAGLLPLSKTVLFLSGRAGFELVQKARMAGCTIVAAVGAPSSLAVELAWESDMTLAGFLRDGRFNLYSCPSRVDSNAAQNPE